MLSFVEENPTLYIGRNAIGWSPEAGGSYPEDYASAVLFDTATRKVYHFSEGTYGVNKGLWGITEVDLDAWEATDYWDSTSTPALPRGNGFDRKNSKLVNGNIITYMGATEEGPTFVKLDPLAENLQWYSFGGWGVTKNVNWTQAQYYDFGLEEFDVDEDGILYATFRNSNGVSADIRVVALDTNDSGPTYTLKYLTSYDISSVGGANQGIRATRAFKSEGYLVVAYSINGISLNDINTGLVSDYWTFNNPAYGVPNANVTDFYLENNTVYMSIVGQKGIWAFDIVSEYGTQIIPPIDQDGYFGNIQYDATLRCLMCTGDGGSGNKYNDGLYVYYIDTDTWVVYNNDNINGITPDNTAKFYNSQYDSVNDGFIVGIWDTLLDNSNSGGLLFIPRSGKIQQVQYTTLTDNGGWEIGAIEQLISDFSATNPSVAFVPNTTEFYTVWEDVDPAGGQTIAWDINEDSVDLTSYIPEDEEVQWTRNILGDAASLSFSLTDGHLFDQWNLSSLIANYVRKGRRLRLYAGETINGVDYITSQGVYYVTETKISYEFGDMSIAQITALDKIEQLKTFEIKASDYLSNVTGTLAFTNYAVELEAVDVLDDIGNTPFIGDKIISPQFMDVDLYELLYTIAWRFGCMVRYDMSGKLDCVRVPNTTLSHTYSNNDKIINFTPNDEFSDLTNDVTVTGISDTLVTVTHEEEMVAKIEGTIGWWGDPEEYTIYYDEDHEKVVRNVRLEVIVDANPLAFQLAGGVDESIIYIDPEGKYCKVLVDAPNLVFTLVALVATNLNAHYIPDWTVAVLGGVTIPWGRIVEGTTLFAIFQILGSIANFQYEIWGQPEGELEREIQNQSLSASDAEHIAYVGKVYNKTIEGWNCSTVNECLAVALRELEVVKMQRRRVSFSKVTHLQDEEGDLIIIKHPHTGQTLYTHIAELVRNFKKGKDGYLLDNIEGWIR
jgi:hypothetical protein